MHYAGCHIEKTERQQEFKTLEEALEFIKDNETDRLKYDFKAYEVKEK